MKMKEGNVLCSKLKIFQKLIKAVSYTHLDVYKRQPLPQMKNWILRISRLQKCISSVTWMF